MAPSDLAGVSYAEAVKQFFDLAKRQAREKAHRAAPKKANSAIIRKNDETKRRAAERRIKMCQWYTGGIAISEIARREAIPEKRVREMLRQSGMTVPVPVAR